MIVEKAIIKAKQSVCKSSPTPKYTTQYRGECRKPFSHFLLIYAVIQT